MHVRRAFIITAPASGMIGADMLQMTNGCKIYYGRKGAHQVCKGHEGHVFPIERRVHPGPDGGHSPQEIVKLV